MTEIDHRPILFIDGLGLFIRGFLANPSLNSNGSQIGGIVGFMNNVRFLLDTFKPFGIIVVWESGGSARRRAIYPDYKSGKRPQKLNRFYEDDIPDSLENRNWQIQSIVSALRKLPICQVYVKDCEADDVIGYLSRYTFRDRKRIIVSSDKDFYQLLDDDTTMWSPYRKEIITRETVLKDFSVHPKNFAVAKAFCGDASDNIPGLPRVGFKTLAKNFPVISTDSEVTVGDIIDEAKVLSSKKKSPSKMLTSIVENADDARRNWKLVELDLQNIQQQSISKIRNAIETFVPSRNKMDLIRLFISQGVTSIDIDRLFLSCAIIQEKLTE